MEIEIRSIQMPIIAGTIAALISYILNKLAIKIGDIAIIIIVPIVEESSKTITATILNTNIITTHFIFGLIEGVYDIINSSEKVGRWAAIASIISHVAFGIATNLVIKTGYPTYWGILLAWLLHSSWNWYVTKYL